MNGVSHKSLQYGCVFCDALRDARLAGEKLGIKALERLRRNIVGIGRKGEKVEARIRQLMADGKPRTWIEVAEKVGCSQGNSRAWLRKNAKRVHGRRDKAMLWKMKDNSPDETNTQSLSV